MAFLGTYEVKVDSKGRLRLPNTLVRQLSDGNTVMQLVVNCGFEPCLTMFKKTTWDKFIEKLTSRINVFNKKHRMLMRFVQRGASEIIVDANDRILLSKILIEYAGLEGEALLVPFKDDRIEIWNRERYEELMNVADDVDMSDVAEELFGTEWAGPSSDV